MSTLDDLKNRRSIRKFKPEQVSEELLQKVLEAGLYAPSARGTQYPIMVVLQDRDLINTVRDMNASFTGSKNNTFFDAPTVIIVFAPGDWKNWIQDGSLVMGNLLNAAHAVGLGACWVNRAIEVFDTDEGKALMKQWGVPDNYRGVGNCVLGYPDASPEAAPRKEGRIIRVK